MYKCLKCNKYFPEGFYPEIGLELKKVLEKKYSTVHFSPICITCINNEFHKREEQKIEKRVKLLSPKSKSLIIFNEEYE